MSPLSGYMNETVFSYTLTITNHSQLFAYSNIEVMDFVPDNFVTNNATGVTIGYLAA